MKKQLSIAALGLAFSATAFAQEAAAPVTAPATAEKAPALSTEEVAKLSSYGLGYQNASQLAGAGLVESDFDKDAFFLGFTEALNSAELKYTPAQLDAAMSALQAQLLERDAEIGEENLKKEAAFLETNSKKEGVVTTESGLQYTIINKGGEKKYEAPKDAPGGMDMQAEFKVNYTGTLIDGTEFDKSPEGQPTALSLQVVPGFAEALKMMPIGAKWQLVIPAKLGYGDRRNGPKLAPNSTLIFELELVEIGKRALPQGGMPFGMPGGAMPAGHPGQ